MLSKKEITALIAGDRPLIADYFNLEEQLQPNGFDLTVREIAIVRSAGTIAVSNARRTISGLEPHFRDSEGFYSLAAGSYVITFNEVVSLPKDVMALGQPRSSLLRCGVTVNMAVWDAGYSGRGQALLTVFNPGGFRIQANARVAQLVFFKLTAETEGYRGQYQGENIRP
ncbi:MAG TPA: deoxyuridine 5'-triphosphate nucleotidohydrolase [Dehalococcoidales bacterium]|nr:deoxyuridine 5'-triphosphate nucleotidohydrolase [Dehalococcoidales bacterium]